MITHTELILISLGRNCTSLELYIPQNITMQAMSLEQNQEISLSFPCQIYVIYFPVAHYKIYSH